MNGQPFARRRLGTDEADEPSLPCVRGLHVGEPDVHRRAVVCGLDRIERELAGYSR